MTLTDGRDRTLQLDRPGSYVRDPAVLWRRAADSMLLLRAGSSGVVVLDDSACLLWRLLDRPRTFDQIVGILSEAYGAAEQTVAPDVAAALARLTSLDLVTHPAEGDCCQEDTA